TISLVNYAVHSDNSRNNSFLDNTISFCMNDGIYLTASNDTVILGNTVFNNTYRGIYLYGSCHNNLIANNTAENHTNYGSAGISIYSSADNIVYNNTLTRNYNGLIIQDIASTNNTVSLNDLIDNIEDGVFLSGSPGNWIDNNIVYNNGQAGIHLLDAPSNNLSRNTVSYNSWGIIIYNGDGSIVSDSILHHNAHPGIYLQYSTFCIIIGNDMHDHDSSAAIFLESSSHNNTIANNTLDNNVDGIRIKGGESNIIIGNVIIESTNDGIWISTPYNIVNNNTISISYYAAIEIDPGGMWTTVTECTLVENPGHGIRADHVDEVLLLSNDIMNNDGAGIYLDACYMVNASFNFIANCSPCIDVLQDSSFIFLGWNEIDGSETSGISITGSSNVTIAHGSFTNYNSTGIFCDGSDWCWIYNNTIAGGGNYGIFLAGNTNYCNASNNTIHANVYHGIRLQNTTDITISANVVYGNNESGICLENAMYNEVIGNEVNFNPIGIWLADSNYNNVSCNLLIGNMNYCILLSGSSSDTLNIIQDNECHPPGVTLAPISPATNTDGTISLSWSSAPWALTYYIYRSNETITQYNVASLSPITNVSTTSHMDASIVTNGHYYYVVIPSDYDVDGTISECRDVIVAVTPASLTITVTPSTSTNGTVVITWAAVPFAVEYKIYRSTSSFTSVSSMVPVTTVTATSRVEELDTEATYYYAVVAVGGGGIDGPISNVASVIVVFPEPPGITHPPDMSITVETTGNTISWNITNVSYGTIYYEVFRNGTSVSTGSSTTGTSIGIEIDGLAIGVYNYTIVVEGDFNGQVQDTVIITVVPATPSIPGYPVMLVACFALLGIITKIKGAWRRARCHNQHG
nr:right-handed parallel beta-helix repeat-containing protein [Candidatus Sigynarchaeota archaeon]